MDTLAFLTLVVPILVLFYLAALFFIHPTRQALLASLLGGLIMGLLNILVDVLAYYAHWWHYAVQAMPVKDTPFYLLPILNALNAVLATAHVSLPLYLSPILIYGSLAYLLVWRFWRGRTRWLAMLFLIGVPLFCIVRDILGGVYNTAYQVWENVAVASIATVVLWIVAFYAGFFVFWRLTPQREERVEAGSQTVSVLEKTQAHAE